MRKDISGINTIFLQKHPVGNERSRAISKLLKKVDKNNNFFSKWINFATISSSASFVAALEIT